MASNTDPDTPTVPRTDPPAPPSMADVMHMLEDISEKVAMLVAVPEALRSLGSIIAEHYQRESARNDEQDRRLNDLLSRVTKLESMRAKRELNGEEDPSAGH